MPARQAFRAARQDLLYAHERKTSLSAPFLTVLPIGGAAISVLSGVVGQSTVSSSDATALRLDELQFDLGEGPCWDAMATRRPVLEPHFTEHGQKAWPLFANAVLGDALAQSVRAIYAFPLYVGSLDLGAIDLYSTSGTPLRTEQVTDATELAGLASWQVLRRIFADQPTDDFDASGPENRREVHQATGMVLAQLNITAEEAALLLRAHAFSSGRTVAEVANDVVERRLSFEPDTAR